MRFTVIGHSCLYVETSAGTILVDPWLIGSCYWRSWWHFPPSAAARPEWFSPDYIHLTHHHFDHFHYPSMRKMDRRVHVLVPRFGVDVMEGEVRSLGFGLVNELPHGTVVDLGNGVRVASFQYGFDDTTFVIADGEHVLVDVNDCKIRGKSLARVVEEFGNPTFVFKSYSFAQSYPIAYAAEDPADLQLLTRASYLEDFCGRVRDLRPCFGVPFGSMVAFLHPENRNLNQYLITPDEVAAAYDATRGAGDHTQIVPMAPGDSWDAETGFSRSTFDWYTDRERHLAELAESIRPKLDAQTAAEQGCTLSWSEFNAYFTRFVRGLPPLTGRFVCKRPLVFEVPSSAEPYWVVDVRHRRVYRAATPPPERASLVRVPEPVMAAAIRNRVVQVVHGAMRIRVELRAGALSDDLAFWGLVAVWELGYLKPRTWLRPRFWQVMWRRRDEIVSALAAARGRGSFFDRMANRFAEPE
jgi:UDP-MurNAc hydroxylase